MSEPAACIMCGRPFRWRAPGANGVEQGWFRHFDITPKGPRCADRERLQESRGGTSARALHRVRRRAMIRPARPDSFNSCFA